MDFFEAQEAARRRTGLLIALFAAAVVAIVAVVYSAVHVGTGRGARPIDWVILLEVALAVGAVITIGSAARTASLRRGGPAVADLLGARRVATDTDDLDERKLINVVEEMAIASGTPVPAIYVLDAEDSINAFAAGYAPNDAAVSVTRGALRKLSRDELQGVIAHEFSHILNGDMRLNIRLIGLLYGILLLAVVGRTLLRFGGRGGRGRDRGGAPIALVALALLLVGYVGVFFGRLIKAAVSRQREYLADSAAVEFTRNPDGLAGALKKIATEAAGSRIHDPHAEELSHLFFANGMRRSLFGFLSTHPPLDERIRRLDPSWTGESIVSSRPGGRNESLAGVSGLHGPAPASAAERPVAAPAVADVETAATPAALVASIGSPGPAHLRYAASMLHDLPDEIVAAAHSSRSAPALAFALLVAGKESGDRGRSLAVVSELVSPAFAATVEALVPGLDAAGPEARVPVLDVLTPALRQMEPDAAARFLDALHRVVMADGTLELRELTLEHILRRRLAGPGETDRRNGGERSFARLRDETSALLSALAWTGSGLRRENAESAFSAAIRLLPSDAGSPPLVDRASFSVTDVDRALTAFQRASHAVRKAILEACAECAIHDRRVDPMEMELLVAIADALDCPMPPVVATA